MAGLDELLAALDPDEYRRGKQFERIVKWFLEHAPMYRDELREVWLWDEWPDRPGPDLGIDLVAEDRSGGLWAIQAKAYAPTYSVTKRDLDSFLTASASKRFSYRLLVATTDRIGTNARKTLEQQAIPVGLLMRSDLATADLIWPSSPSRLHAPEPPRKELRPDQQEAVNEVLKGFATSDRGQMIRACGTGKTIAALGVHEQLDAPRTLVLVPSLSLLSQILREWKANTRESFEYLVVCSDETVADPDSPVSSTHGLGVPVTTDADEIAAFLRCRGRRVVFSTYQSSSQIAAAYRKKQKPPRFDLAICDEAHRCAGSVSSDFATILDATKIHANRRLFMTATPRYFTGRIRREASEADFEIASMDDEATFGPVFHRLTFAQAIDQDLLSDYRVVIVGVDDATYRSWAEHGKFVTRDGKKITDARTLAGQIGLAKAIREFDLRRVITFHGRVAAARSFSGELPDVISWMPPGQRPTGAIRADYVSGQMPTGERRVYLDRLAETGPGSRSVIANARCLAEGVDVPTLDGVAFIDPRRSEVDIVQAVGRAIRLAPGKELGTVVLPVFIDADGNPETVLNQSVFKPVWDVLKALRSHDAELGQHLDALRTEIGRTGTFGHLPGKIVIDLPATVGTEFAERFSARLIEQATAHWDYGFGKLLAFLDREGHTRVPKIHQEGGVALGSWVATQRSRYANKLLSKDRAARLEALSGWTWDAQAEKWEAGFAALERYVAREGHMRVPRDHAETGVTLGRWIAAQRQLYANNRLSQERTARLEALSGWTWVPQAEKWEAGFASLKSYVAREEQALVPRGHRENGYRLGKWVEAQRHFYASKLLSEERVARLEAIPGWSWGEQTDEWEGRFAKLERYVAREGHPRVPMAHREEGALLGAWIDAQRNEWANKRLSEDRVARLEAIPGWSWGEHTDEWEDRFATLERYVTREGHARVPKAHREDGVRLGAWVDTQRHFYSSERLSEDRVVRLEALSGWTWDPLAEKWEAGFAALERYVAREGHARVPYAQVENGIRLGAWVGTQRKAYAQSTLSEVRVARLDAVPGWTWRVRS